MLESRSFEVFADYHQFYLWDRDVEPMAPVDYDDVDVQRRLKVGPNVVIVQPLRNTTVPVTLEIHEAEPEFDPHKWDHIVEGSLQLPTGNLQVHECTGGPVADVSLAPGSYRVRAFFGGLCSVDGLDGDDHYKVVVWPSIESDVRVIKEWREDRKVVSNPAPQQNFDRGDVEPFDSDLDAYGDALVSVRLPKGAKVKSTLREGEVEVAFLRSMRHWKGPRIYSVLIITVSNNDLLDAIRFELTQQDFIEEWAGVKRTVIRRGQLPSEIGEGVELLVESTTGSGAPLHHFQSLFLQCGRNVNVRIDGGGQIEDFDRACSDIVRSIEIK